MKNFRARNEKKNAWKYRSEDYISSLREENAYYRECKSKRDYFHAGGGGMPSEEDVWRKIAKYGVY